MKTFLKFTTFLINGLLFLSVNTSTACSYTEYGEDIRISMFRIMSKNMLAYYPFLYTAELYHSSYSLSNKDKEKNLKEWSAKLGKHIRLEDTEVILYKTDPILFYSLHETKSLGEFFKGNTFIEEIIKEKNANILEYILISKGIEYREAYYSDPWISFSKKKTDFKSLLTDQIMHLLQAQITNKHDAFLKKRYFFQYIRMLFQINDYETCRTVYHNNFNIHDNSSILNPWALHYCAIAEKQLGDSLNSNYHMSLVFASCDDKKYRMYTQFNKTPSIILQTLNMVQSPKEKANILAMTIINNPGKSIKTLLEIEALDPNNKSLDFLILREINKLEDWLLTPELTLHKPAVNTNTTWEESREDYLRINYETDRAYLKQVISLCERRLKISKGENRDFFSLALAHLYTMDENNAAAIAILPPSSKAMSTQFTHQNIIEQLILLSSKDQISNITNKEKAGSLLMYFDSLVLLEKGNHNKSMYALCHRFSKAMFHINDPMRGILFLKLADDYKYGRWGYKDYIKSTEQSDQFNYYLLNYMDQSATANEMNNFILFIQNKEKNIFDSYIARQKLPSVQQCIELRGSKLFREGRLEEALLEWSKLDTDYWQKNGSFRYYLNANLTQPKAIYSNHEPVADLRIISKSNMLKKILLLQDSSENASKNKYLYKLQLAHAWYNISWFGNSWIFTHYYKSVSQNAEKNNFGFGGIPQRIHCDSSEYLYLKTARRLYSEVIDESTNPELRCEALVMLQFIDYETFYHKHYFDWKNKNKFNPKYKGKFWKEYENTKIYQKMYMSCPLFESFVSMN